MYVALCFDLVIMAENCKPKSVNLLLEESWYSVATYLVESCGLNRYGVESKKKRSTLLLVLIWL